MKNNKTVRAERFLERNSNATNSNATAGAEGGVELAGGGCAEGGVELDLYILSDGEMESFVGGIKLLLKDIYTNPGVIE